MDKSTLYLIPTPIGNIKDITFRALDIMNSVDIIVCEDTRHTKKLLTHYGISKPLVSYERFSEAKKTEVIIDQLESGKSIALVSDAGTPIISDPGARLISQARSRGIRVEALPGPCAFITALSASGFEPPFRFIGFFPRQKKEREKELLRISASSDSMIFYESPRRLLSTLKHIIKFAPDRELCVAREITKLHEEYIIGTVSEVISQLEATEIKGEITVLVKGVSMNDVLDKGTLEDRALSLLKSGYSRKDILHILAQETGTPRNELYQMLISIKID